MAGSRLPLEVLEGRGKKHLSKRERANREAEDIKPNEPVKRLVPPKWLTDGLRDEFLRISKALISLMPNTITRLEGDTIAAYCIAHSEWRAATSRLNAALMNGDPKEADSWSKVQQRCFAQARACANDLGMTITSRCRLVLPEGAKPKEENPFEAMMKARAQRA